jgi:hypothetical protein
MLSHRHAERKPIGRDLGGIGNGGGTKGGNVATLAGRGSIGAGGGGGNWLAVTEPLASLNSPPMKDQNPMMHP